MQRLKRSIGLMLAAVTAGTVGATMLVSVAAAQAPPNPPSRFVGSVTVDGVAAASGVLVEARIGNAACGSTSVFIEAGQSRYALDVPGVGPTSPGCGADGSTVEFFVGGKRAGQTAPWANFQLNQLNLTVSATTATVTSTPLPPVTGQGAVETSSGSTPVFGLLLLAAVLGLGGVGIAARVRNQ